MTTAAVPLGATSRHQTRVLWWPMLLVVGGAWGVAAWAYELRNGLASTGMRDVVSWGLYIFTFAFLVGLSAGGLIVTSSAEVFGIRALKPLSRLGVLAAAACITVAGLMIIPDLGRPARILELVRHPHWSSPLIWDILIIAAYFAFSLTDLFFLSRHRNEAGAWRRRLRVLAYVGLPTAVLLHSVTAWIFGLQIARAWWNTSLMAPLFVVSAILSGTALVTVLALLAHRFDRISLAPDTLRWLRGLLAVSLAVDLFFVGSDYITILWGSQPAARAAIDLVLPGGSWSWLFWTEWIAGGVIPFLLLVVPRLKASPWSLGAAAVLAMVGVFAFRVELVVIGFITPLVTFPPGIAVGTPKASGVSFQMAGTYHPSWVEYGVMAGLLALFCGLVSSGYRRLHMHHDLAAPEVVED